MEEQKDRGASLKPATEIFMCCTPWFPVCRQARAYFKERGIPYVEIDIFQDRAAAAQVRQWADGNETTPTFEIKGKVIVYFKLAEIEALLSS